MTQRERQMPSLLDGLIAVTRRDLLLADVPLWLMDEPFTNLDREGRALVMELVKEHLDTGGMCVMAAHQDVEIDAPVTKVVLQ